MMSLYVFLHEPKINVLYSETCDRVEQQVTTTKGQKITGGIKGTLKLGSLLKHLLLEPEIGAELSKDDANSSEVIEKLVPAQKLRIIMASLKMDSLLADLNDFRGDVNDLGGSFFTARSKFRITGPFQCDGFSLFEISGSVGEVSLHCTAPLKSLTAGQMVFTWKNIPDGVPFEIFGIVSGPGATPGLLEIDPVGIRYFHDNPRLKAR